uniref:Uncharacterized protein n=1 Tax=viral metagenome TaxID=1070528 RepID=A0A6H1ZJ04_9ZZZZ
MNVQNMQVPIDNLSIQNDVKMRLIELIESSDILSFGLLTEVVDGWDEEYHCSCKVDSGIRSVSIRLRLKEKE